MSDLLVVQGIDPGGTTGMTVIAVPRETIFGDMPYQGIAILSYEHLTGPEEKQADAIAAKWNELQGRYGRTPMVIEQFSLRVFSRSEKLLSPVRITALVKDRVPVLGPLGQANIFFQMPAAAMKVITNSRLKEWNIAAPRINGGEHARDALRHGMLFLRRAKTRKALRDEAWG